MNNLNKLNDPDNYDIIMGTSVHNWSHLVTLVTAGHNWSLWSSKVTSATQPMAPAANLHVQTKRLLDL